MARRPLGLMSQSREVKGCCGHPQVRQVGLRHSENVSMQRWCLWWVEPRCGPWGGQ